MSAEFRSTVCDVRVWGHLVVVLLSPAYKGDLHIGADEARSLAAALLAAADASEATP